MATLVDTAGGGGRRIGLWQAGEGGARRPPPALDEPDRARGRMDTLIGQAASPSSRCQTARAASGGHGRCHLLLTTRTLSFPRRSCARVLQLPPSPEGFGGQVHPREGWAERRQAPGACEAPVVRRNAANRGACEAPRRPLRSGRRASRRSTPWRFWASGPCFRPRHFLRSTCSQLLAARVVVPGERFPSLPRQRLRAAAAERHSPLRLQNVSGDAPHERG